MLIKTLIVALVIAVGEAINGNIRVRILHRKFGKKRAKKLSFFSGIVLIFSICWLTLPWIGPKNYIDCFIVGFIWFSIMLGVDIFFGKYVFKLKWYKIAEDFNLMKGNLLNLRSV
ncbi:MAG: hypothetical protein Q9N32_05635 [Gammaproteobacteria bacterium]|nr:hypothetical protein [Gammaproteobacteria bacterium]